MDVRTPKPALFLSLLPLIACESGERVALDMERALVETNTAIVGALLASEVLTHVYEDPDTTLRHTGSTCGCPCIQRIGDFTPYILTLDYPIGGCVPQSRLLPTALTGHAVVEFDGAEGRVTWDSLLFALEHEVTGEMMGEVSPDGSLVSPRGALTIGDQTMEIAVDALVDPSEGGGITFDGEVTTAPHTSAGDEPGEVRAVVFEALSLPYSALSPPCPRPASGSATHVHEREKKSALIQFDEPGDGFVTVQRDDRVSEPADFCAYASELW